MYKIAVIYSAYYEMEEVAKQLMLKKGYHIEVLNAILDEAVELAMEYEKKGFDLIISRGATGALIRKSIMIPVVNVEITNFDIFRTLGKAKEYGTKIAFFQHGSNLEYRDFEFIRKTLDISEENLKVYNFKSNEELNKKMAIAHEKSVDLVIGIGTFIMEVAKEYGIKTMMVHSTKEAIYNAFEQAVSLIKTRDRHYEINNFFNALVVEEFTGLIFLDMEENIKYLSDKASVLLDMDRNLLLDKNISYAFKPISLFKKLLEGQNSYLENYKGNNLLIKKTILEYGETKIGYAIKIEYSNGEKLKEDNSFPKDENIHVNTNPGKMVARYYFSDIVGQSKVMEILIQRAKSYSKTKGNILITGGSGTGKEVFASSIHNESPRNKGPFVAVNCAALPQSLLESELFGYEDGAFTGARKGGRMGLFELAKGGTIFLDEVSEITPAAQAQLLRVLEERVTMRIGGNKLIPIDVRVVAATNADLSERIQQGQFRMDLFYRLNVLNLRIPGLNERKEDIPLFVNYFISSQTNNQEIKIPDLIMNKLIERQWNGNVRELKNFVDKLVVLFNDIEDEYELYEQLLYDLDSVDINIQDVSNNLISVELGTLVDMELQIIEETLRMFGDNKTDLARRLGISRTSLWNKLKEIDNIKKF